MTVRGRSVAALGVLAAALAITSSAFAHVVAESNSTQGSRKLHQDFDLIGKAIDYHLVAHDPDGLYPYCTTVQLEKPTERGWKALPKSNKTFRRECLKTPAEGESQRDTFAAWDTFIYPSGRLFRKFKDGELRLHGFTDLGGKLIYRR